MAVMILTMRKNPWAKLPIHVHVLTHDIHYCQLSGIRYKILSELPKYNVNKYQSPASVATAIDDMADAIVTKATQKAKEAIENAACGNSQTKQQSALE